MVDGGEEDVFQGVVSAGGDAADALFLHKEHDCRFALCHKDVLGGGGGDSWGPGLTPAFVMDPKAADIAVETVER